VVEELEEKIGDEETGVVYAQSVLKAGLLQLSEAPRD